MTVNALFRVFADGAGVEQDHIGDHFVIGQLVAHVTQQPHEHFPVGDVLLAAEGVHKRQRRARALRVERAHLCRKFLLLRELFGADQYFFAFQDDIPPE